MANSSSLGDNPALLQLARIELIDKQILALLAERGDLTYAIASQLAESAKP